MKFLENFKQSVFQTFKDKEASSGYAKVFEKYDEPEFQRLNKVGCGVYFTPNGFKGGRKIENLTLLNAVYADLDIAKEGDGKDRQELKNALRQGLLTDKLQPNYIIETKNGLQPLWLIEPSDDVGLYQKVIKGIIEWSRKYGCTGDKVYDVTRVLRLPNYYHMKGDPFLCGVEVVHEDRYPLSFMEEAYPYEERLEVVKTEPHKEYPKGLVSQEIDRLDFQELIVRAFAYVGRRAEFDSKKRLVLDGRLTGTHQGKTGDGRFLASNSHEPFEGNQITAPAVIMGVTPKEAFAWIKEQYGLEEGKLKSKKVIKDISAGGDIECELEKEAKVFTWGTQLLDRKITPIQDHHFIILAGGTGAGKTAFSFDVAMKNANEGKRVLFLSLEMSEKEIYVRVARTKAAISKAEWRERDKIAAHKKDKYRKVFNEIQGNKNVLLKGFPHGVEATVDNILSLIEELNPDLTIIDNFDLVKKDGNLSEYLEQNRIAESFMNLCHKKQRPIIMLHHVNPKSKNVGIGSMRGSGKIADDCDVALFCSRKWEEDASDKDNAMFMIKIEKDRDFGQLDMAMVYFVGGTFCDEYPAKPHDYWQNNI